MNDLLRNTLLIVAGGILAIAGSLSSTLFETADRLGSVSQASEYIATSTAANTVYGATITGDTLIQTGPGTLGSVVITGANTGIINFYNATTTDATQRTTATSTILLASIPASAAAGTYTFDVRYFDGLYVDIVGGNMPTTTITYR